MWPESAQLSVDWAQAVKSLKKPRNQYRIHGREELEQKLHSRLELSIDGQSVKMVNSTENVTLSRILKELHAVTKIKNLRKQGSNTKIGSYYNVATPSEVFTSSLYRPVHNDSQRTIAGRVVANELLGMEELVTTQQQKVQGYQSSVSINQSEIGRQMAYRVTTVNQLVAND